MQMSWLFLWKAFLIFDMAIFTCLFYVINYSLETGITQRLIDPIRTRIARKKPSSLQLIRQHQIQKYCSKTNKTLDLNFHQMLYSGNHSLVYCGIPKAAITNWIRVLLKLNGQNATEIDQLDKEDVHLQKLPRLKYSFADNEAMLSEMLKSFTFTFVRHPLVRLVSAYRNKLEDVYTTFYQETIGSIILEKYRKDLSPKEYEAGVNVTFNEFIRYIIDTDSTASEFDVHWEKMVNLCYPCSIKYDFIGKMETIESDADEVFRQAGLDKYVTFPKEKRDKYEKLESSVAQKYFSTIPKKMIKKLYQIYSDDFEAFGYEREIP